MALSSIHSPVYEEKNSFSVTINNTLLLSPLTKVEQKSTKSVPSHTIMLDQSLPNFRRMSIPLKTLPKTFLP